MTTSRNTPRTRWITAAVLAVAAVAIGARVVVTRASAAGSDPLTGSGTIEATIITLSPQLAGQVADVLVQEGDTVAAGDVLLHLDDMGLQSQRTTVLLGAQAAQAAAQVQLETAELALRDLRDNAPQVTAQTALALANARKAFDDAQNHRSYQQEGNRASDDTIKGKQAELVLAQKAVDEAADAVGNLTELPRSNPKRARAEAALYDARRARDLIRSALNWYTGSPNSADQAILDAQVELAQANLDEAQAEFDRVKVGPDPEALQLAESQVAAAQASLDAADAQEESSVEAIDLQLKKLEVRSSSDGVILVRNIQPGETTVPGATLFQIGQLSTLEITVYLPEEQYARVRPGENAQVHVDAYPDRTFAATVLRIADQAEFTPRNVQTVEGRKDTVYAIRLSIANPDMALKPGMPADVSFGQE